MTVNLAPNLYVPVPRCVDVDTY